MFAKRETQLLVNALIQKDFHWADGASYTGQAKFLAFLQNLDGKLSADCRETFQKVAE